jgi:large subunit ribosomal protein L21
MYAVISTGGKQYRVQPGDTLRVEKLDATGKITFDQVLLVSDGESVKLGGPVLAGATVTGDVIENGRGEKLLVYKYRRRKGYRRKTGHRQEYTAVKISGIHV